MIMADEMDAIGKESDRAGDWNQRYGAQDTDGSKSIQPFRSMRRAQRQVYADSGGCASGMFRRGVPDRSTLFCTADGRRLVTESCG